MSCSLARAELEIDEKKNFKLYIFFASPFSGAFLLRTADGHIATSSYSYAVVLCVVRLSFSSRQQNGMRKLKKRFNTLSYGCGDELSTFLCLLAGTWMRRIICEERKSSQERENPRIFDANPKKKYYEILMKLNMTILNHWFHPNTSCVALLRCFFFRRWKFHNFSAQLWSHMLERLRIIEMTLKLPTHVTSNERRVDTMWFFFLFGVVNDLTWLIIIYYAVFGHKESEQREERYFKNLS